LSLAILKTELELAGRGARTNAELQAAVHSAGEEVDRLTRLAEDLLVLARADGGTGLPVRADQVHLQQVILNLATNGMDAMCDTDPDRRRMSIQTAVTRESEVEVSVTDSGTGIPHGKLGAVFETFYTTKQQGTGLGLSIARTIVETYGGRIWAENRIGGGAVFRFTLPLCVLRPA